MRSLTATMAATSKIAVVLPSFTPCPSGQGEVSLQGGIWIGDMNASEDSLGFGLLMAFRELCRARCRRVSSRRRQLPLFRLQFLPQEH